MNYCSLQDAFGSPGCDGATGGKEARKEERRKAKRCKGPAATFLDINDPHSKSRTLNEYDSGKAGLSQRDPDRQGQNKLPEVPPLNRETGLKEHTPVDAMQGELEPFQGSCESQSMRKDINAVRAFEKAQNDDDAIIAHQRRFEFMNRDDDDPEGDKERATRPNPASLTLGTSSSFFGKDPEEGFANYVPDSKNYLMEPSFTSAFNLTPGGRAGSAALPVPSVRDVWKPPAFGGTSTSFFNHLPNPGGSMPKQSGQSHEMLSRKIDGIMSRLEELHKKSTPEQTQTDILLFVSSGIFVLFMMDLLVRKGSSIRFLSR
jgi:hypothetical protein